VSHEPECDVLHMTDEDDGAFCICDRLRAYGQRVMSDRLGATYQKWLDEGYAAGLSAARDAVAAVPHITYATTPSLIFGARPDMVRADALAAIDALREPPHVDPCDCDRCRAAALRGES